MKIGIITVNYNSYNHLCNLIASFEKSEKKFDYNFFILDNNSKDKNQLSKLQNKKLKIINLKKNLGFGGAINYILKKEIKNYNYFIILNPDIILQKHTLDETIKYIDSNDNIGILGPKLYYPDNTLQDSYRKFPNIIDLIIKRTFLKKIFQNRMKKYLMWDKDPNKTEEVDWVVGAFMVLKANALKKINFFDERFFLFFEDVDLCKRMWKSNYKVIYYPKVYAIHNHERLSSGGIQNIFTKKTLRIHILSAIKYFIKHFNKN